MINNSKEIIQGIGFQADKHATSAIADYLPKVSFYKELSDVAKFITSEALTRRAIKVHSIEARAKSPESFGKKASKQSVNNPDIPMYENPLLDITDLSAIRIITFYHSTIDTIDEILKEEFEIIERSDKSEKLIENDKFGYKSIHYLVKLNSSRVDLPEYKRFKGAIIEVQVRTILQHTWAEIEHDIQYKSTVTIPKDIRRRFASLAGLLEIADREFEAIHHAEKELNLKATENINSGNFDKIEISPIALKAYLDNKIGPDGRMSDFSYDWTIRLLSKLGFTALEEIEECIAGLDGDEISSAIYQARQGQLTRFELMLFVGMGQKYIERHPWSSDEWFVKRMLSCATKLVRKKIELRAYDPLEAKKTKV